MDAISDEARQSPGSEHGAGANAKRRKIRKGTRSCWECKRRKIRCSFSTSSDAVCIGCRRRGTSCISQEYRDEITVAAASIAPRGRYMGDRIVRVEALVEHLAKQVAKGSDGFTVATGFATSEDGGSHTNIPTPGSSDGGDSARLLTARKPSASNEKEDSGRTEALNCSPARRIAEPFTTSKVNTAVKDSQYDKISATLHAALPPREDIHMMIKAGTDVSFHKLFTHPYPELAKKPGAWKANLADIPGTKTHPTLLARYLLILATCLQYMHPEINAEEIHGLSEPPSQMMRRLIDTVNDLVTTKDEFLGSIEGIECIMLEAMYQANSGNLRRAWFAVRRAMVVAQMMGIHRSNLQQPLKVLDPNEPVNPSFMWYRIVCTDRQLSLMLGLPQGSLDVSMASEAALAGDSPSGRFERKQQVIASRILERNESADPATVDDFAALQEIDAELQRAANEMPIRWWLVPNLASVAHDVDKSFWETMRLMEQMLYFNLLNLLHLPYMLRSSTPDLEATASYKFEHSKLTSVNASRELLTRFIMFRSFNRIACCCRSVDFFALIAAMTLLIAHLDEHRKRRQRQHRTGIPEVNVFAHQRNGDRAMMEQVLESMEGVAKLSTDVLSERSSILLKRLLILEAAAAAGNADNMSQDCFASSTTVPEPQPNTTTDDGHFLRIDIPYFGTIRISRDGVVSKERPLRSTVSPPIQQQDLPSTTTSVDTYMEEEATYRADSDVLSSVQPAFVHSMTLIPPIPQLPEPTSSLTTQLGGMQTHQQFVPHFSSQVNDTLQEQYLYPGLTAGADDWAFQGVDMAFFDSLIGTSGGEGFVTDGSVWVDWEGGR
ncbi:hypothetical protein LTR10_013335 [Elasticomyces elasticus]|uniref:Zn(2)-C6 fungal-type domain-containing protein n=1 Tax=Exophiala sideris TaxID=1016849 RepID=A0ABR0J4N1_9EURO|nr:hypothetical protein LTR10_013335 [Elasticomyces elasticus]KAK5027436.1 hypothetical protein LTS07_007038 [Exophiala sideris]KAK5034861.1 hypothetical protein LTR13_006043 [Exophiala sideris]KAK5056404.1 hypothetical protein LTR69_007945 [Exophiala sideris]KAK5181107.1 hypothetical protein LTR44_006438 [Eurotiomycetes sp. CCFEE 6388]